MSDKPPFTTSPGIPVGDNQGALTAGPRGPLLVQDWQPFEKHAHLNRERIPERAVHAKGSGAYGTYVRNLAEERETLEARLRWLECEIEESRRASPKP